MTSPFALLLPHSQISFSLSWTDFLKEMCQVYKIVQGRADSSHSLSLYLWECCPCNPRDGLFQPTKVECEKQKKKKKKKKKNPESPNIRNPRTDPYYPTPANHLNLPKQRFLGIHQVI
jgi:hypothetical protein